MPERGWLTMARMPGATWRPIPINYTNNGQSSVRGVVVHIMAGTLAGTDSWFRNSRAQASSHFGTGKTGALYQWVDTSDRAWAQASGNSSWLSVENEGKGGDALTSAQMDRIADVLRWAHEKYGVPLQVASSPSGRGLGYHAMGGAAWGGHTSCPGSRIVAQLPEIVARAKGGTTQEDDDMQASDKLKIGDWLAKRFPSEAALQDGSILVETALASGYGWARIAADNSAQVLAQLGAQQATIDKLVDALGSSGGITAEQVKAAAEEGAQSALDRLGDALTREG